MQRRTFLEMLFSATTLLALNPTSVLGKDQKTLLVIELAGGNDGLNTFIPYADSNYLRLRPRIGIKEGIPVSHSVALNPGLKDLKPLLESGQLAVIQNVGYPNPDLSHFRSKEIWQSAHPQGSVDSGWLARYLEAIKAKTSEAVFLGDEYPLALTGSSTRYLELSPNLGLKTQGKLGQAIQEAYRVPQKQLMAEKVRQTVLESTQAVRDLARDVDQRVQRQGYPQGDLGRQLALVSRLVEVGPKVIYLTIGGWDTHVNQVQRHQRLLEQVGQGLLALNQDLKSRGLDKNILTMVQSEFGRRPTENGSGGTDHGTAGPVWLIGPVRAGFYGGDPALDSLQKGNLPMHVDFRSVYAEILDRWLSMSSKGILSGSFPGVGVL
jgi:uncharacterized protein (DUF1501 family)